MSTEIEKARKQGYAQGYAAGQRRKQRLVREDRVYEQNAAFLDRAFLAAFPTCIAAHDWTRDKKPITNVQQRTQLAWDFAAEALKQRRRP